MYRKHILKSGIVLFIVIATLGTAFGALMNLNRDSSDKMSTDEIQQLEQVTSIENIDFIGQTVEGLPPSLQAEANGQSIRVMIQLEGEAAATAYARQLSRGTRALAVSSGRAAVSTNRAAQSSLLAEIAGQDISIDVLFQTSKVYNGIAATVDSTDLYNISQLPGVASVERLPEHTLLNKNGVTYINAPTVWRLTAEGMTGEGIKVGIIDTGIDYIHTAFGGSGLQADYDSNDETDISDGYYDLAKFGGGYDFVGDDYNAGDSTPTVAPDGDPMDCGGHGTHVAGTAGGYGVNDDGTTYTGTYTGTLDMGSFSIGPGSAPGVKLYGLRVFGCTGSTNYTVAAIEWAMDPDDNGDMSDHLDVINLSLGGDIGSPTDPGSVAINNAVEAGMLAAVAAGNSGDASHFLHGSPGTAALGVGVAGVEAAQAFWDAIEVTSNSSILTGTHAAAFSSAYPWGDPLASVSTTIPVTATLVYPDDDPTGCASFSITDTAKIAGNIVLLDWTDPSCGGSVTRTGNAINAGAVGIIIADNEGSDLRILGSSTTPAVMVPEDVGNSLRTALQESETIEIMMSYDFKNAVTVENPTDGGIVYASTSRGPAVEIDGEAPLLKPDLAAPGVSVFSADAKTGSEGVVASGTSMATPHVAGVLALLREMHPDWTPEQIKALLVNVSTQNIKSTSGDAMPPQRVGAGTVDLSNSIEREVVAYNGTDRGHVGVAFGHVQPIDTMTVTKEIMIENMSSSPMTYTVEYTARTDSSGMVITTTAASVTIPANSTETVEIMLVADPSQMSHEFSDPTLSNFGVFSGVLRNWITEESGHFDLINTAVSTETMRIPVYASGRPASDICTTAANDTETVTVTLSGSNGLYQYPNLEGHVSMGVPLELQYQNETASDSINSYVDIEYVGAASNLNATKTITDPTGVMTDTSIYFGLGTFGHWSTPLQTIFEVHIDSDQDGTADYILWNWSRGYQGFGRGTDDFVVLLTDLSTSSTSVVSFLNLYAPSSSGAAPLNSAPFHNNKALLSAPANLIGLASPDQSFNYTVRAYDWHEKSFTSSTPTLTFSAEPGVSLLDPSANEPYVIDYQGNIYTGEFDADAYLAHQSKGLLWFHMLNSPDSICGKAEVQPIFVHNYYLPVVNNSE